MKGLSIVMLVVMLFPCFNAADRMRPVTGKCPFMDSAIGTCKQERKQKPGGCQKGCGCIVMLSVNSNIFITVEALTLKPVAANYLKISFRPYKTTELPSYYPSDWKPPKC
jgi:hypothetical protein